MINLDSNANTLPTPEVVNTFLKYSQAGNINRINKQSELINNKIESFKTYINDLYDLNDEYEIVFNSGACEGNCTIIRTIVDSQLKNGIVPHILISNVEHSSVISCCRDLGNLITYDELKVDTYGKYYGCINPDTLVSYLKKSKLPSLIFFMYANNENGSINSMKELSKIAHEYEIPFASDCVQIIPRYIIKPRKTGLDAFTMSFHKMYGFPSTGALIVRKDLIVNLKPLISGHGHRAGTINAALILSSYIAFMQAMKNREEKTIKLEKMKTYLINKLNKEIKTVFIDNYENKFPCLVLCMNKTKSLPNTVFLSTNIKSACNIEILTYLDKKGIMIGLGSACNSKSENRILSAINAPAELHQAIIRVSINDYTTLADLDLFVKNYIEVITRG
jgi:cysteine desulfurase